MVVMKFCLFIVVAKQIHLLGCMLTRKYIGIAISVVCTTSHV